MVQVTPEEPPQQSVDELAHQAMDAARADPTLLSRAQTFRKVRFGEHSAGLPATVRDRPLAAQIPSAPLVSRSDTDHDQYLEQLVALAVSSAQQAEDALRLVGGNGRTSRRTLAAVAGIGALGVLVGIIGVADRRLIDRADARLTQVDSAVSVLADMQQETSGQVSQLRARTAQQPADARSAPRVAGAATSDGVPGKVADRHPGTGDQLAEHPVPEVAAASSEATPPPAAAAAPTAASPTQPYGFHPPAPAGPPASPGYAELASNEGTATQAVATTPVAGSPTQPYGLHPVVPVGLPAPSADVPSPPGYGPRVVQHAALTRRPAMSRRGASSGNPVRDAGILSSPLGTGFARCSSDKGFLSSPRKK